MRLGVVQHAFRDCRDDDARFARARRLGIELIEPDLTAADLAEGGSGRLAGLRAAREAHGVGIASLCMGFHNGEGLVGAMWRGEAPVREILMALGWCEALGGGCVVGAFLFRQRPAEPGAAGVRGGPAGAAGEGGGAVGGGSVL